MYWFLKTFLNVLDRTNVEERRSLDVNGIASNITGSVTNDTAAQFLDMDVATITPTNITEWNWIFNTTVTPTNVTEWSWMPSTETCIFIYALLVIGIVVLSLASAFFFFSVCMTASINLHNSMFNSISRATVWFFNNNPSGNWEFQFFCREVYLLLANASVCALFCFCPSCIL